MDNASYHSRRIDKAPTAASRKADIHDWLTKHNIPFEDDMLKTELLAVVKGNKTIDKYVIDELATVRLRI